MGDKTAERVAKAFGAIGPLTGLAGTVASAVPGLKKPKKSNVRVSSLPAAQAALATAAQGYGVGRGGATLQALRAAGRGGQLVASQQLAAQSQNEANNINQDNARNRRIQEFGLSTARGVADLGVGLVDAANARKAERLAQQKESYTQPDQAQPAGSTGAMIQGALGGEQDTLDGAVEPPPLDDLLQNPEVQQQQILSSLQAEMQGITGEQMRNRSEALNQARAINGMPPLDGLADLAPDLEFRNKMINFGIEEIHKRGLSALNSLAPLSRALGTDLTQILNPPQRFMSDGEEDVG